MGNTGDGVWISDDPDNTIGNGNPAFGNIISGNGGNGVKISGSLSVRNLLVGNIIGTNRLGATDLGNAGSGVVIELGAHNNSIGSNTPGSGNVISGNHLAGVSVTSDFNLIAANIIGLDPTGMAPVGNWNAGISISGYGTTVGGTTEGARNIISANFNPNLGYDNGAGILVYPPLGGSATVIMGNDINTDATGLASFDHRQSQGIIFYNGETSATIGGSVAGAGNVIAGVSNGGKVALELRSVAAAFPGAIAIQGNLIGVGVDGSTPLPTYSGIAINGSGFVIGGSVAGARNVIASNYGIQASGDSFLIQNNIIGLNRDGTAAVGGSGYIGLSLSVSSNSTIGGTTPGTGNVIAGFYYSDIDLANGSSNLIAGNLIGTDAAGLHAITPSSAYGIRVDSNANTVGGTASGSRNVISGNNTNGVFFTASSLANVLAGNYIGTDITGQSPLPNGIGVSDSGESNTIGGLAPGSRNVISGNRDSGILISGATGNHPIVGNYVGTDSTGNFPVANGGPGISILNTSAVTIGGTSFESRNVISGNTGAGVYATGDVSGLKVLNNYIGTNAAGTAGLGNTGPGVWIDEADPAGTGANTIHIGAAGSVNVISANRGGGVRIDGPGLAAPRQLIDVYVQSNKIGTDVFGTSPLGNVGFGIQVGGTEGTIIGLPGAGNVIAYTEAASSGVSAGVLVSSASSVSNLLILANSMRNNAGLGIDNGADGLTEPPVTITSLTVGATSTITGTATGLVVGGIYSVDVYTVASSGPLGHGEGFEFLGRTSFVPTSSMQTWTLLVPSALTGHQVLTATITGPDNAANNTSNSRRTMAATPRPRPWRPARSRRLRAPRSPLTARSRATPKATL